MSPTAEAEALIDGLAPYERMIAAAGTTYRWGPVALPLAVLEHATGRSAVAEDRLRACIDRSRAWGTATWTAQAQWHLAAVLVDRAGVTPRRRPCGRPRRQLPGRSAWRCPVPNPSPTRAPSHGPGDRQVTTCTVRTSRSAPSRRSPDGVPNQGDTAHPRRRGPCRAARPGPVSPFGRHRPHPGADGAAVPHLRVRGGRAGLGIVFLRYGWPLVRRVVGESRRLYINALIAIDWAFHTTLILAGAVVCYAFLESLRQGRLRLGPPRPAEPVTPRAPVGVR